MIIMMNNDGEEEEDFDENENEDVVDYYDDEVEENEYEGNDVTSTNYMLTASLESALLQGTLEEIPTGPVAFGVRDK